MRVEEIDGLQLVKRLAENMEEMFHKKAQAMKVGASTSVFVDHTKPSPSLKQVIIIKSHYLSQMRSQNNPTDQL